MLKLIPQDQNKPRLDLDGPSGNVFSIIGNAQSYGRQLGFSNEKVHGITQDMMSSDYTHALKIFIEHFGEYVDIVTIDEQLYNSLTK